MNVFVLTEWKDDGDDSFHTVRGVFSSIEAAEDNVPIQAISEGVRHEVEDHNGFMTISWSGSNWGWQIKEYEVNFYKS